MIKVVKFGGSSLSDSNQFKKVKDIVLTDSTRKVVVISALGKRSNTDSKITDLLYILHAHLKYQVPYIDIWNLIVNRFVGVRDELQLDCPIENDLKKIEEELNKDITIDYLVSRGEYLTAKLMSSFLEYTFIDAKEIIKFKYDSTVDIDKTECMIRETFSAYQKIVVPGFYGSYPNEQVKLLSRGGSDITGAYLAAALDASIYENFTDVSGILAADPRIIINPKTINEITYAELREMSYMGASVLHDETIFPVKKKNIPINIKNTNDPLHLGTLIKDQCIDDETIITGISGKTDFISITISKEHMSNEVGFLRKTLSIFEKYNCSIDHIPSGIDTFSVVLLKKELENCKYELLADLKKELNAEVIIEEGLALVSIVGRNMRGKSGINAKLFTLLGEEKINVRMIAQGPREFNVIVGVDESRYNDAVKAIYEGLLI